MMMTASPTTATTNHSSHQQQPQPPNTTNTTTTPAAEAGAGTDEHRGKWLSFVFPCFFPQCTSRSSSTNVRTYCFAWKIPRNPSVSAPPPQQPANVRFVFRWSLLAALPAAREVSKTAPTKRRSHVAVVVALPIVASTSIGVASAELSAGVARAPGRALVGPGPVRQGVRAGDRRRTLLRL